MPVSWQQRALGARALLCPHHHRGGGTRRARPASPQVVAKHRARGVSLSVCGLDLDPYNRTLFEDDAIHLRAEGYRRVFACLKPALLAVKKAAAAARG